MNTKQYYSPPFLISSLLLFIFVGCGSNESKITDHLSKADRYFESGDYAAAEIENLNAIKLDNLSDRAFANLGVIYYDQGRPRDAYQALKRADQLKPGNIEVSQRLGFIYLGAGEQGRAREVALNILENDPSNTHAPIILANSLMDPKEVDGIIAQLSSYESKSPNNASYKTAVGLLLARLDRVSEARVALERALEIDPDSPYANSALANLYIADGESQNAESNLIKASDVSSTRSTFRLQLIGFYLQGYDQKKGEILLDETLSAAPNLIPALVFKSKLQNAAGDSKTIDTVNRILKLDPAHHDGLVMKGALLARSGNTKEATTVLVRASEIFPSSPSVHFELSKAYLAENDIENAFTSISQCLKLEPNNDQATAILSRIQLHTGDFNASIANLQKLLVKNPENPSLQAQLAAAYRGQGNYEAAIEIYDTISKAYPDNAQAALMKGQTFLQQNDIPNAVIAYEESLKRDPNLIPALDFLINYYLSEKRYDYALDQISLRLNSQPNVAAWHMMKAKVNVAQNDTQASEKSLLKAIELEPDNRNAYMMLTQLYLKSDNRDGALSKLEDIIAKNPKDIPALMTMSGIYENKKNWESARYTYEKILSANPNFGPALNNLAYLYSIHLDNIDRANELAEKARQEYPLDPSIADTLGWIKYQLGDYEWARSLLQESSDKLPDQPEVHYHLGSAQYMLGNETEAKASLERSLSYNRNFTGQDEAERKLMILNIDIAKNQKDLLTTLETTVKSHSTDPIAHVKLAQLYEKLGNSEQALKSYDNAIAANQKSIPALIGKAGLLSRSGKAEQALTIARKVYDQRTNDPLLASKIGRIAYLGGDHAWSANVLQEAVRRLDANPELQLHLAESLLAIGRISDAQTILNEYVGESNLSRFLQLVSPNSIEKIDLKTASKIASETDNHLVQLWVDAIAKSESANAVEAYETLLQNFPEFLPAKRELAIRYAFTGGETNKAYKFASEAIRANREDDKLKQALGILEYRKRNFARAAELLIDGQGSNSPDARVQFYLGMALYDSGKLAESVPALSRSIELGISGENAKAAESAITKVKDH